MKTPEVKITFQQLDNDFNRFPLPISFDPEMEKRLFYARSKRIERIMERYNKMILNKTSKSLPFTRHDGTRFEISRIKSNN